MNPLSTWTYYRRHKRYVALLLSLAIVITIGLYSMVALVWGVFVETPRLVYMGLSKFSMVTPVTHEHGPDMAVIDKIRANPDVAQLVPTTIIPVQIPGLVPGAEFELDLLGLSEKDILILLDLFEATLTRGHLPEPGTNELLLSEDVAAMLDLQVGDRYDFISSQIFMNVDMPLEPTTFEVTGVLESEIPAGIVSLEFLSNHGLYRQFPARFLVFSQENREAAVDAFLRSEIQSMQTAVRTLTMLNERIMNEAIPGLVMLLPVILIVATAFALVIVAVNRIANAQRLPEFGILHTTGLSKRWLTRRLTLETTLLTLIGWAMGIGLSWLALYLLKVTFFASRGYYFNYITWIPIVFTLPIPVMIAGFTIVSVRRTFARLDPVAVVERGALSQEGDRKEERTASNSSPKPLAPTTFYKRHRRRAALLASGMGLMILAVVLFIFALAVNADAQEPLLGYLSRVSIVRSPEVIQSLDPDIVARIKGHPAVERVIPMAPRNAMLHVSIPPFTSAEVSPYAVHAENIVYLVELYDLELKEGRLPRPGTNEMVIPETVARNRDLKVGDVIGNPDRPAYPGAPSLPIEFVISGIFARPKSPEDGIGWGFISLEFLEERQVFPMPDTPPLIVVPKAGQKELLDDWLENELAGPDASVLTYRQQLSLVQEKAQQDMLGIAFLEGILALVAAIALAVLNYIFAAQRQSEFGVLHALGYGRWQLIGRMLKETVFMTGTAWGFSVFITLIAMLLLRFGVFAPRGLTFSLFNLTPWLYTLPIPVAVLAVTTGTTARTLFKLDPVAVIERRQ
jgi:ABC-type lipoprotein release transport system permease subunit